MAVSYKPHRFDVDEYYRMAESGILPHDRRTELIDGQILDVSPQGNRHRGFIMHMTDLFQRCFADQAIVSVQSTLILRPDSAPEPDFTLFRRRPDLYMDIEERPSDILLIAEVADSSLRYDRTVKARVYAKRDIVEYWIVDINAQHVLVHRDPSMNGYCSVSMWSSGSLAPLAFPERPIEYLDLFAPVLRSSD